MIRFTTKSGSRYEIDGKRIRRTAATNGLNSLPIDVWRTFFNVTTPRVGRPLFILWPDTDKATITTPITKLEIV